MLGACAPKATETPAAAKATPVAAKSPVTLKLALWGTADYIKAWEGMVKVFEQENAGITVEIVAIPWDQYYQKLQVMLAGTSPLDTMIVEDKMLRFFASNGVIRSIDEHVTKADTEKFFAATLGPFIWQGKTYGLPRRVNNTAVYINKTMFEKAGIPIPGEKWSQADFFSAARKLTVKGADGSVAVYGADFNRVMQHVVPWVWSNGGEYFDKNFAQALVDMPETVRTLETIVDLCFKDNAMPTPDTLQAMEGTSAMFVSGKLAMIAGNGVWLVPTFRKIKDFEWDVVPLPEGSKGRINIVYASCFAVPTHSKYPDEAIRFLLFSSGAKAQAEEAKTPTAIPSIREVAESNLFLDPSQPPKNMRQFLKELEGSRPAADVYHPTKFMEVSQAFTEEWDVMFRGKRSVADTMKALKERLGKLLA